MPCRVGMTSNVLKRKQAWLSVHPNLYKWDVLKSGLTYAEALAEEQRIAEELGCENEAGGQKVEGSVYSIYCFHY